LVAAIDLNRQGGSGKPVDNFRRSSMSRRLALDFVSFPYGSVKQRS